MDTLYKADVFFFVSTIALGVLSIFLAIVLWRILVVINEARKTLRIIRREVARAGAFGHVVMGRALKTWSVSRAIMSFISNLKSNLKK